jgi:hypothetical protein
MGDNADRISLIHAVSTSDMHSNCLQYIHKDSVNPRECGGGNGRVAIVCKRTQ